MRNRYCNGQSASSILDGGTLYVQVDHTSRSYLLAVDPRTGADRWKADRPTAVNWTSPLAVTAAGRRAIVTFGTHAARAYDAATGAELWHVGGMHQQCIPSPVVDRDLVIACSGENTMAIRLAGDRGDLTESHVVWKNKKAAAFVPSPLSYQGYVYVPTDRGFVTCLDARTGKQVWKERVGDNFHASPVGGADRVYFPAKDGTVKVVRAGPSFEVLAENALGEGLVASPAIAHGQLFLRGEKHLYCIAEK